MAALPEQYGRPWSEEDYVLALWYYHKYQNDPTHQNSPHIRRLASLLKRNVDSVLMRFENYASVDGRVSDRAGLRNIGWEGQKIFDRWKDKIDGLQECAEMIERGRREHAQQALFKPPFDLPRSFAAYEPEDRLDVGGMANVYTYRRIADGRLFAIKVLKREYVRDEECFGRFRQEIKILKRVIHPRIIRIFEDNLDTEQDCPAYVMELAERSLQAHLEQAPSEGKLFPASGSQRLPPEEGREIFAAVCEGVEALHTNEPNIIHRDINPSNILLMADRGWVLADFGIAKFGSTQSQTTAYHTTRRQGWGTPECTAPEQRTSFGSVGTRADIYALGVILFNLFAPGKLFDRSGISAPKPLRSVILTATAKSPERRFQTVRILAVAAEAAIRKSFPSIDFDKSK